MLYTVCCGFRRLTNKRQPINVVISRYRILTMDRIHGVFSVIYSIRGVPGEASSFSSACR